MGEERHLRYQLRRRGAQPREKRHRGHGGGGALEKESRTSLPVGVKGVEREEGRILSGGEEKGRRDSSRGQSHKRTCLTPCAKVAVTFRRLHPEGAGRGEWKGQRHGSYARNHDGKGGITSRGGNLSGQLQKKFILEGYMP